MVKVQILNETRTYDLLSSEDVMAIAKEKGFSHFEVLKREGEEWVPISLSNLPISEGEVRIQPHDESGSEHIMYDLFHFLVQLSKNGPDSSPRTRLRWQVVEDPEWLTEDDPETENDGEDAT